MSRRWLLHTGGGWASLKNEHPGHRDTLGVAEAQPRKAWMPGKYFHFCSKSREVLYRGLTSSDLYFKRILPVAVLRRECRRIRAGVAKASKETIE